MPSQPPSASRLGKRSHVAASIKRKRLVLQVGHRGLPGMPIALAMHDDRAPITHAVDRSPRRARIALAWMEAGGEPPNCARLRDSAMTLRRLSPFCRTWRTPASSLIGDSTQIRFIACWTKTVLARVSGPSAAVRYDNDLRTAHRRGKRFFVGNGRMSQQPWSAWAGAISTVGRIDRGTPFWEELKLHLNLLMPVGHIRQMRSSRS